MTDGTGRGRETFTGTPEERRILGEITECMSRLKQLESADPDHLDSPAMLAVEQRLAGLRARLAAVATQT